MSRIHSRYMIGILALIGGLTCIPSRADIMSEDGGAGVFRLQSAKLPEETVIGVGLYSRLLNLNTSFDPFNSLIQNDQLVTRQGTPLVEPTKLLALSHVLAASVSTNRFIEAHVALPLYTQYLNYKVGHTNSPASIGDVRLGLKLAMPMDEKKFPIAFALLAGGSAPTAELGTAPIPTRLEYFTANPTVEAGKSHATGTHRDDWHLGVAATVDFQNSLDIPLEWHFNVGARKTSGLKDDKDFYDIITAGTGFEGKFNKYVSLVGEYWHENHMEERTGNPRVDDISLGLVFNTPVGLSFLVGGSIGLKNDEADSVHYYDQKGKHQYDMNVRSSADAQVIAAVTYAYHFKPGDADRDGILDKLDKCPNQSEDKDGFEDDDGCPDPDNDKDGIPDRIDNCPNEAEDVDGFEDLDGCPDPDNDQDGVADAMDKCPDEAQGLNGKDGCASHDGDGDGIPDDLDKCPNQPEAFNGYQDDDGCPDSPPQQQLAVEQKTLILKGVAFETGKAVLTADSYAALDDIARQLSTAKDVVLEVSGHTDDRGAAELNMKLSKARAQSVANYLMKAGVAPSRLQVVGYGSTKPIASNKTAEGRSQNRRVEFNRLK
jgi:outer membrane protein OmpA-like peptidoglycan-associated protein